LRILNNNTKNFQNIRSFGRVKSRKLSKKKETLIEGLLVKYKVENLDKDKFQIFILEIGSGEGNFLFNKAKKNQDQCFIACETHLNSVANILDKLNDQPLDNFFIFNGDARDFLANNDLKFSHIFILNPDPWPKLKQYKRRIINKVFLELLHKNMSKDSNLTIVTDHDDYKLWIIKIFLDMSYLFIWYAIEKSDWLDFPQDWVFTKYQKKAILENRQNVILNFNANYTKVHL